MWQISEVAGIFPQNTYKAASLTYDNILYKTAYELSIRRVRTL